MNKPLTKTCMSCGQQKPLSAFLQIGGAKGSMYGNVCASCRKTTMAKSKAKDRDGSARTSSTATIDIKSKVKSEQDKRKKRESDDERYREGREKAAGEERTKVRNTEGLLFEQRRYREEQFAKRSVEAEKKATPENTEVVGGETQRAREEFVNLEAPVMDTQIPKLNKGEGYKRLIAWLPDSFPLKQAAKRMAGQQEQNKPETGPQIVKKNFNPK